MTLDYRILGNLEVWADGRLIDVGGPRQRRLIGALLLADGRPISADRLVEIVWLSDPPGRARNTLRTYVARARRALEVEGAAPLVTDSNGWSLQRDGDSLDSERFESLLSTARSMSADPVAALAALEEALGLWRGDALVEFDDEDWCVGEATRLNELRLIAEEERIDAMLGCGLFDDAIGELERFVNRHPLRDRPRGQQMLALYRAGRQVDAVRRYQEYRRYLDEEIGVEPSDELRNLELLIVNRDPSLNRQALSQRQLRGFLLGPQIGEGAFGRIYRATQPTLGREVAIKVVRPDLADAPEFMRRFDAEAEFIARLEHPHIVPLFDYWREPGGAYLVMRYLRGGNAMQLLESSGPFSLERVGRIVDEIGSALAAAHSQGVVHCDLKPANILFDDDGGAYLGDFGIATDVGAPNPAEEKPLERVVYLSPEQAVEGVVAATVDIYAFGAVLFELLTGDAAFSRTTSIPEVIEDKRNGTVPTLTDIRSDLPEALDDVIRRALQPDPADRYNGIVEMVVDYHRAADPRVEKRPAPPGLRRPNPYKGLAAFAEADAANFFGRDELVERLEQHLAESTFVAVVGPSGSGKSSTVRAGLAPRLRKAGAFVVSMTPGAHPVEELTRSLLQITPESREDAARRALRSGDEGLIDAAALSLPASDARLVVVVDQFEELFTVAGDGEREQFLRLIAAACRSSRVHLQVVTTIRADFYDRPLSDRVISELVEANTIPVTPLTPAELERAITGPAERAGVGVEPGLVAALVADAAGSPASLPLVQYVLTELFDRREGDLIETASYLRQGGLSGAIARRADELYEHCGDRERDGVRRLFGRLVAPGDGTEDTRRRVLRSEVAAVPAEVIESYGAARLLTFDHDAATREPTVEVAHEALIREWPRLRAWLDSDREGLRLLRHVSAAATAWVEADRDPDELYRGGRLEALEGWIASNPGGLSESEAEFVGASATARDAEAAQRRQRFDDQVRSNRRLRRLLVGVGTFAILALVAGLLALQQRRRADDEAAQAEFDRLVTLASVLPEQDLQLAMLAAVEAFDMREGPAGSGALQQALMSEPRFAGRVVAPGGASQPPTRGPDGEWLFVTDVVPGEEASSGTWFDAATLESIGSVKIDDRWRLYSSPGRTLVASTWMKPPWDVAGDERLTQVRLHDPQGRELASLATTGRPTAVRFLDEDLLAVSDSAGLTIWNARTLEVQQTVDGPDSALLETIEVDADGSLLLVSSSERSRGTAMLIDLDEGAVVPGTITPCEARCPIGIAPTGEFVAIAGGVGSGAVVRDVGSWEVVTTIVTPDDGVESLDFSEDGATLYVGTSEGELAFYDTRTGDRSASSIDMRAPGAARAVMRAPAEHIVTISSPGVIQRWSLDRAGPFGTWLESGEGFGVFSPDSLRFVRTNDPRPGWLTVYESATGDVVETLELDDRKPLGDVAFSADGQLLAVSRAHGDVVVYHAETLQPTGMALPDRGLGLAFLEFSPDGDRLAIGANAMRDYDGYLRPPTAPFAAHVWHIESGEVISLELTVDFEAAGRPTWSPDGTMVALSDLLGGDAVFDAATGRQVGSRFSVRGQDQAREVLWEPNGESLLGAGAPGISRWDVATGERTSPFTDATPAVWMDMADDGQILATASPDGEARLWDLGAEMPLGEPFPDPGLGRLVDDFLAPVPALSDDGRFLAMSGGNGSALWSLDPQIWRARACRLAGRNMTETEWANVMGDVEYRLTCDP